MHWLKIKPDTDEVLLFQVDLSNGECETHVGYADEDGDMLTPEKNTIGWTIDDVSRWVRLTDLQKLLE